MDVATQIELHKIIEGGWAVPDIFKTENEKEETTMYHDSTQYPKKRVPQGDWAKLADPMDFTIKTGLLGKDADITIIDELARTFPYTVNTTTSSDAPGYFGKENDKMTKNSTAEYLPNYANSMTSSTPLMPSSKVTYKGSTYGLVCESSLSLMPMIEKVIFNPPATVVLWKDGTKTIVKVKESGKKGKRDKFSEEYGLAMAIAKKFFGSRSAFQKAIENAKRCE